MDAFSYLSVLLSIILGLGITQVLTAAGRLIRGRASVVTYWPPLLWAAVLLVIDVQVWWSMFGMRTRPMWTFLEFFVVLLQTLTLYMMAALALPESADDPVVDLRVHYERQSPWFFGFLVATLVVSLAKDFVLDGHLPARGNLAFHGFLLLTGATAMVVRREWYHKAFVLVTAAAFGAYIVLLFWRLG